MNRTIHKRYIFGTLMFISIVVLSLFLPMREIEEFIGILAVIILLATAGSSMHAQHKLLGNEFISTHKKNIRNKLKRKKSNSKLIFYGGILVFALLTSIVINKLL